MKPLSFRRFVLACLITLSTSLSAQDIERWDLYEVSLPVREEADNPFKVKLTATFTCPDTSITVHGFYDGNHTYRVRFMPTHIGTWSYTTHSPIKALNNKKGSFKCIAPTGNNHGLVTVSTDGMNFAYADGTRFLPVGTTAYGWTQGSEEKKAQTLQTLRESGFNKVRMCIFPAASHFVGYDPEALPFQCKRRQGESTQKFKYDWDFTRPNPQYFQNIEDCIVRLRQQGIEADLILFHPYDKGRWGLDAMPMADNLAYLSYIEARFSAYSNVWWSMANEFDLIKTKTWKDWDLMSKHLTDRDPYGHLCSIHGATATYYDYWLPQFTHTSIQDEAPVLHPGRAAIVRNIYHKPVIFDEICYEGNVINRWGRLSGQEICYRMWNALMSGTYVTHGECLAAGESFISRGGKMIGDGWRRVRFMRNIIEDAPDYWQPADVSRDEKTATAGQGHYLIWLGQEVADTWLFSLPTKNANHEKLQPGIRFKVEIIDTWNMTIRDVPGEFETAKFGDDKYRLYDKSLSKIQIPYSPYILLRVTRM